MKFVKFNEILMDEQVNPGEQTGEDDGMTAGSTTPAVTRPVYVNADAVRSFSARRAEHGGNPPAGTRLAFANSAGMIVLESVDEVLQALQPTLN